MQPPALFLPRPIQGVTHVLIAESQIVIYYLWRIGLQGAINSNSEKVIVWERGRFKKKQVSLCFSFYCRLKTLSTPTWSTPVVHKGPSKTIQKSIRNMPPSAYPNLSLDREKYLEWNCGNWSDWNSLVEHNGISPECHLQKLKILDFPAGNEARSEFGGAVFDKKSRG